MALHRERKVHGANMPVEAKWVWFYRNYNYVTSPGVAGYVMEQSYSSSPSSTSRQQILPTAKLGHFTPAAPGHRPHSLRRPKYPKQLCFKGVQKWQHFHRLREEGYSCRSGTKCPRSCFSHSPSPPPPPPQHQPKT